tara:strand:- start:560 stop:823 length:264 start_codon:yes stop_codon:yes gene_type:complete
MNKFTIYTDNTQESTDFVTLCRTNLDSDISQIVILSEGTDFTLADIEVDSLPALKFTFLDGETVQYDVLHRNLASSKSYLKEEYLIP